MWGRLGGGEKWGDYTAQMCVSVCVCVCACVRACVRECMGACVRVCFVSLVTFIQKNELTNEKNK